MQNAIIGCPDIQLPPQENKSTGDDSPLGQQLHPLNHGNPAFTDVRLQGDAVPKLGCSTHFPSAIASASNSMHALDEGKHVHSASLTDATEPNKARRLCIPCGVWRGLGLHHGPREILSADPQVYGAFYGDQDRWSTRSLEIDWFIRSGERALPVQWNWLNTCAGICAAGAASGPNECGERTHAVKSKLAAY
jgi:hypothetical protein